MNQLTDLQQAQRRQHIYLLLLAAFVTNAVLAEIIGAKIFSVEKTLGLQPLGIALFGNTPLSLDASAGVTIWPFVFIITDLMNEYFGKKGVRKATLIAVACISYAFFIIYLVSMLVPADFWLEVNSKDADGNYLNIDDAFTRIFRQSMAIIFSSLTAFIIGQLLDASIFAYLKSFTGRKRLWIRATASTLGSQLVDSFLILLMAFYWLGNWSLEQVLAVGMVQYAYKIGVAVLLLPLLHVVHEAIDRYLGWDAAPGEPS
jgi:hypothetical protein